MYDYFWIPCDLMTPQSHWSLQPQSVCKLVHIWVHKFSCCFYFYPQSIFLPFTTFPSSCGAGATSYISLNRPICLIVLWRQVYPLCILFTWGSVRELRRRHLSPSCVRPTVSQRQRLCGPASSEWDHKMEAAYRINTPKGKVYWTWQAEICVTITCTSAQAHPLRITCWRLFFWHIRVSYSSYASSQAVCLPCSAWARVNGDSALSLPTFPRSLCLN